MNSPKPLQDCNILITRPIHQTQSLNEMISSVGGSVILFPTIEIIPATDLEPLHTILQQLKQWNIAIFVSANAVHAVMKYWPQQPSKTLQIVAIGPGTAKTLLDYGISMTQLPNTFNSEGLLELPLLQSVRQKKIILFAGAEGRPLLLASLLARGAKVTKIDTYQRRKPQSRLQQPLSVHIIVSTSRESLQNLYEMTDSALLPWLLQTPLLVISPTMIEHAKHLGFQDINSAENASDAAVFKALLT